MEQVSAEKTINHYLQVAAGVINTEAAALKELAAGLDDNFIQAVDLMFQTKGRVIVTGMGKSGHIGKKIAATMASTGTPAFFVHPAEASHGDMGMIVKDDVVLAISNSGEVKELLDLIEYTRRFGISLVAITSKPESSLAKRADVALILPNCPEACPNGQAPTTSTTLTLALGDALAVTLLEKKGFSSKDFKIYHPGGKLGQQLMRVSEIMHQDEQLPVISTEASVLEAVEIITNKGFGCVAVTDSQGTLQGIITDGDLRRKIGSDIAHKKVSEVMTANPRSVLETALVAEAMGIMNDVKGSFRMITSLMVVNEDNKLVGLLHIHDCLRAGFS